MQEFAAPASMRVVVDRLRAAGCVFVEDEAKLLLAAVRTTAELDSLLERRVGGEPLEYVLGWAEFCGHRIAVDAGVFVPRRRTEFLAQQAIVVGGTVVEGMPVVVDLCCGSGALGVAVLAAVAQVELHAADVDPAAVRCARRNIAAADGRVYEGDLYEALPRNLQGRVDVLVANGPYVPTDAVALMPPEARLYEARVALDGGSDGLDILRRVFAAAPQWLAKGGAVLVETSERQAPHLADAAAGCGLTPRISTCDDYEATVVIGVKEADRVGRAGANSLSPNN